VFVIVVVGGLGSVGGALVASLLIGCVQTFAVGTTLSLGDIAQLAGAALPPVWAVLNVAQIAPVLPFVMLVAMLALRPRGLFGQRGDDDV
jgi:branched-chain amino acid transport system permease protein